MVEAEIALGIVVHCYYNLAHVEIGLKLRFFYLDKRAISLCRPYERRIHTAWHTQVSRPMGTRRKADYSTAVLRKSWL